LRVVHHGFFLIGGISPIFFLKLEIEVIFEDFNRQNSEKVFPGLGCLVFFSRKIYKRMTKALHFISGLLPNLAKSSYG
jgi:hypothetical protein